MTIRPANAPDLPALNAIFRTAVLETDATCYFAPPTDDERLAWWQAHQDPNCPIVVAEDTSGRVLGYASLSWWVNGPVYAHTVELSVYIAADARGRGIGKALTQAILNTARALNHRVVIVRIWAGNAASIALFTGLGFETVGVLREVGYRHEQWEDCIVMQKFV